MFESVRATVSFVRLSRDLNRLNEVFKFAETLRDAKLYEEGVAWHQKLPGGAKALLDRPRLGRLDLAALGALPEGTLGREFADFLAKNQLDPNDIPLMESRDPGEFIFAQTRSAINHTDCHAPIRLQISMHRNLRPYRHRSSHRFQCIADQVEQYLLQLDWIGMH